jgi:hypothetical protein
MEGGAEVSAGKGDTPRPVNAKIYGENYENIFRKTKCQNEQQTVDSKSPSEGQDTNLGSNELPRHFD